MSTFFSTDIRYHAADGTDSGSSKRPWQPGVWKRTRWLGLGSLLVALVSGLSTIVVLLVTDGMPVDQWSIASYNIQPAVVLSILITLSNAAFKLAFAAGMTIP
jgi:hypothetical protein